MDAYGVYDSSRWTMNLQARWCHIQTLSGFVISDNDSKTLAGTFREKFGYTRNTVQVADLRQLFNDREKTFSRADLEEKLTHKERWVSL